MILALDVAGAAPWTDSELDEVIPLNAEATRLTLVGDRDGLHELLMAQRSRILSDPLASFREAMATAPPDDLAVMQDNA